MSPRIAARILSDYNKWRRGEIDEIKEDVFTVGQAIDYAISKLEESKEVEIPKRKMKRINYENKSFKTSKNNS